jgi:hypothetical protein
LLLIIRLPNFTDWSNNPAFPFFPTDPSPGFTPG